MGHGKETPRQKMIGMMYLVLTAMLALNVSKSVLDAFVLIDDGLMRTTLNFVAKNQTNYDIFEAQMDISPARVAPVRENAHAVKQMADQLAYDMQELKVQIVRLADGANAVALTPMDWMVGYGNEAQVLQTFNVSSIDIQGKDNKDKPAQIMIHEGGADVLKAKIDAYREFLISLTEDESVIKNVEDLLSTSSHINKTNVEEPWNLHNFAQLPLVAVITNLTRMQSDVRNAEAEIVADLLYNIGATDTRVNKMEAVVLTRSNFVLVGNEFEARVMLAAYDSLQRPEILIGPYRRTADGEDYEMVDGGTVLPYDERGRAIIRRPGSSVGNFTVQGLLRLQTPDGLRNFPFEQEYQVGQSTTVISADAMNVLYIGIENPISIQMSGVPTEQIQASISNGTIRRTGNSWIAVPASTGTAVIRASATVEGRTISGQQEYRTRLVPSPVATVASRQGGPIERNVLANAVGVVPDMGDFLFNLTFRITRFNVEIDTPAGFRSEPSTSPAITAAQRAIINSATRNQRVFFTGIRARGPDGREVNLADITFVIQ